MKILLSIIIFYALLVSGCSGEKNGNNGGCGGSVVILMYHRIIDGEAKSTYERSLMNFKNDINILITNNINIIDFRQLESFVSAGRIPEGNHAIITFDDGDISWYNTVRPVLAEAGLKATFFLWAGASGTNTFVDWERVRLMSSYRHSGGSPLFTFESHSFSHPYLASARDNLGNGAEYNSFLDYELGESKRLIEAATGTSVSVLALPYGDGAGDELIIAAAVRNGYTMIRTSEITVLNEENANLFRLPGIAILNVTSSAEIGAHFDLK
jgi:peptidoglycan/xylan/chitin deacetylase (PgdA/CDA1 family)